MTNEPEQWFLKNKILPTSLYIMSLLGVELKHDMIWNMCHDSTPRWLAHIDISPCWCLVVTRDAAREVSRLSVMRNHCTPLSLPSIWPWLLAQISLLISDWSELLNTRLSLAGPATQLSNHFPGQWKAALYCYQKWESEEWQFLDPESIILGTSAHLA